MSAAFGGLKQAPDKPPAKYAAGATLDQGEFLTQFVKAADVTEKSEFGSIKRYLQMTFKVTNQSNETATVGYPPRGKAHGVGWAGSLLSITPVPENKFGPDTLVRDHGIDSSQLQPGVPATVIVRYQLEAGVTPPQAVTLNVGTFTFTQAQHAVAGHFWSLVPGGDENPATAATVTLDVEREQA
ncbi:hypothetical protein J5X84_14605 [Streptosporangiaceae bacterium NEAU-GS5]|nr:hypothetical protein [Streptosporangiaceae bacterium NEAU-GS5]